MHKLFQVTTLLALAMALGTGSAGALVRYDFEQAIFSEAPQPVLDHCVVEQDGVYHLFYLRGNPAVNIGHATTTDFIHWTTHTPVLSPGTWDGKLWAPQLIPNPPGGWLMYYTGVNLPGSQQSGVAYSPNLNDWFKWADPLYHPATTWALWSSTAFSHGRDPHVMEYEGNYYMFVTAKTATGLGAVAAAVSTDLLNWTDIGPIFVNSNWHVLESVYILEREGKFHMFFTEEAVNGTSHMYSDNLLTGWDMFNRRIIDGGHAPQVTETHLGQMFSRHAVYNDAHGTLRYVLRFSPMTWVNDLAVVPKPLPLTGQWTQVQPEAFFYQPTFGNNAFVRNQGYPTSFVGDGWINTYEYYTGPMGFGSPGSAFGETRTGKMRSNTFSIQGNSMNLLVGGGNYPNECYVALVDAQTTEVLFTETGKNSDVMDKRYWDLRPHIGKTVYIEMADLATGTFGHIAVDEIVESYDILPGSGVEGSGNGRSRRTPGISSDLEPAPTPAPGPARLVGNSPNPFNPSTAISFELPRTGRARIDVFSAGGLLVATLVDGPQPAGRHTVEWNGTDARGNGMASGVYFYRFQLDGREIDTRKMVLLK